MAHGNARRNERNLIRTDFQYNYTSDSFKGVDFSSPDGRCDDEHFAYLENLYRDKEKADGAVLESVPGYRMINKSFEHIGEIYGVYSHGFWVDGAKKTYILVHKGNYLYSFPHEKRDIAESLTPIAKLSATRSCPFVYGGTFYLLDGEQILGMTSPTEVFVLGDTRLSDAEKEAGALPQCGAYIPLTYRDGAAWEARNMLTGFFDIEKNVMPSTPPDETQGLFYRVCYVGNTRGLEVYALEEGRRIVAIPASIDFNGEELPVLAVAEGAFRGRNITMAVLAPSVKVIGDSAFRSCQSLERVLIHGAPTIGKQAFYGCTALRSLAVKETAIAVAESAFEGCSALSLVFVEAEEACEWIEALGSQVSCYTGSSFYWVETGKTMFIPMANMSEQTLLLMYGGESKALQDMVYHHGMVVEGFGTTDRVAMTAVNSSPYLQYSIKGNAASRYVFVSVYEPGGKINTRDEMEGFRIPLPDHTERVVSVSQNGNEIGTQPNERGIRYVSEYSQGHLTSIRVVLPKSREKSVCIEVRCYSERGESPEGDFRHVNLQNNMSLYDAISFCRLAAVFDGKVFLSGNPALPDTVFYSVTPKRSGEALMFAPTAFLACRDTVGEVAAFAVHPLYLAVLKERSLYAITRKASTDALHETYEIDGWCESARFSGATHTFGDEPLFLSERGVMALKSGKAWEEGRIENRSYYIDKLLLRLASDHAAFTEWKGYLVLLMGGKLFLADASISEKKNGVLAYEWYLIDGIGHYENQTLCYHHLAYEPYVRGKKLTLWRVNGKKLSILGEEKPVEGKVLTATLQGITVYYTVEEDENGNETYYLVDSHGEMAGGFLSPATCILSAEGCLYFATSDGYLFCFNTDKRGKAVVVNGKMQSVASDEMHESYYSFDGRRYRSRLVTANVDMGVPHLLKSTVARSFVVRAKAMPHAAFTVAVRQDGGPWEDVGFVVANRSTACPDADRFVFSPEDTVNETLADRSRGWLSKQVMISADVFESPIGIDALAYRYKMAGRAKSKTK